jgi:hypothetical protein
MKKFVKQCACCGITLYYEYEDTDQDIGKFKLPYYRCFNCLEKIKIED